MSSSQPAAPKTTFKNANLALKDFRELTDPQRKGEPNSDEVLASVDTKTRAAVGAQSDYFDANGNSVVTEHVKFNPQEFVRRLVRNGFVTMEENEEVVCLEWRAFPGSLDNTLYLCN